MRTSPASRRLLSFTGAALAATLVFAASPTSAMADTAVAGTACTSSTVVAPAAGRWQAALSADATADMTELARQKGLTVAEAVDDFGWHNDFSLVVGTVQEKFPAEYGGASIEDKAGARGWVAFAGAAPAGAVDILRASPVPVAVREHCGHSEAELKQRLEQVHYAVLGHAEVADASSGYDIETGEISVMVESKPLLRGRTDLAGITAAVPPGRFPVDIEVVKELGGSDDITIYGGRALSSCTTGFNIIGSAYRGTTTAAHCGNAQSYSGYALEFRSEHSGNYGDLQVHRLNGHSFPNTFTANGGLRAVNGVGAAITNQSLCLNGKTSGYHCDTVYQLNHCNGSRCGLVAMHNRLAAGGDSGGPWFSNNHAYGIHQGSKYWFGNRDLYTPAVYLPNALNVSVATY